MKRLPFIARLAYAALITMIAFGITGVGTAAAATASDNDGNTPSRLDIVVKPAPMAQVGVGGSFTDTFVITNHGRDSAKNISFSMAYDPTLIQVQGAQFDRAGAWVTKASTGELEADLGKIGGSGDAVRMSVNFLMLGSTAGASPKADLEVYWQNDSTMKKTAKFPCEYTISAELLGVPRQMSGAANAVTTNVLNITAGGFNPNETVVMWYNLPNGTAEALYVHDGKLTVERTYKTTLPNSKKQVDVKNDASMFTDANGQLSINLATGRFAPGAYSIVVHGTGSDSTVVIPFKI